MTETKDPQAGHKAAARSQSDRAGPALDIAPKADQDQGPKAKRRIRNFLLQPLLQVKLGLYAIFLSFVFVLATGFLLYSNFANFVDAVVQLTDVEDDVKDLFLEYWAGTRIWIFVCSALYLAATVLVSVMYTHRLVGPTVAFRRHIKSLREGKFQARSFLRRGDAFSEVADELNLLSEVLEKGKLPNYSSKRD